MTWEISALQLTLKDCLDDANQYYTGNVKYVPLYKFELTECYFLFIPLLEIAASI